MKPLSVLVMASLSLSVTGCSAEPEPEFNVEDFCFDQQQKARSVVGGRQAGLEMSQVSVFFDGSFELHGPWLVDAYMMPRRSDPQAAVREFEKKAYTECMAYHEE